MDTPDSLSKLWPTLDLPWNDSSGRITDYESITHVSYRTKDGASCESFHKANEDFTKLVPWIREQELGVNPTKQVRVEFVRKMSSYGMSPDLIARMIGVSLKTISNYLSKGK